MKKISTLFVFLILVLSLKAQQLNKVYVLSEGGMSTGTSMLSLLEPGNESFTQNIFTPTTLGAFPDGLVYHDNYLYLTEQGNWGGSGNLYKLDLAGTVQSSMEIGTNPYSLAISGDKIYITNGPASSVSVVNISDFSTATDITVGAFPQEIIANEDYVFVANSSVWGGASDSTVSVINSETDQVVDTITVKLNPSSLAFTNDGNLLIGCPGDETNGMIYEVDLTDFSKVDSFKITTYGFGKDIFVDKNSSNIYFKGSTNDIVELNPETGESAAVVTDNNLLMTNGYAYDYSNQAHYIVDAIDYTSNGALYVYNSEGTLLNTYETSIAPRRILLYYDESANTEEDVIITDYKLEQNYPNPFNPTTTISFTIPEASNVHLRIYNTLGELVSELIDGQMSAGSHYVKFDATNLTSGIYFYSIQTGNYFETRKMMLLK